MAPLYTATARFTDYFNHSETSDVKVVTEVVQIDENLARRQLQLQGTACETATSDICAHAIILMSNSPVWKAQLERWQDTGEPKKITMMVEKGEEAAAYKLVQCLYTACLPDIKTDVDLRLTLGILMLADQYQVEGALSLSAQKLEELTDLGMISWDLADRVMQLPAGYFEKPGLSHLLVTFQEKILQHAAAQPSHPGIGLDLEVVMCTPTLEKTLMVLPLRKCASLLSDNRCRVASENTVAAAVVRRIKQEPTRSGEGSAAQIMGDVIRVPHLSSLFAAAMPTFASQLTNVARPEVYALGRELDRMTAAVREEVTEEAEELSFPKSWLAKRRPLSTLTTLEFDWAASTAEVADAFDAGKSVLAQSPEHFFAGINWGVELWAKPVQDNDGRTVGVYVYGDYPLRTKGPLYGATVSITMLAPDQESSLHRQLQCVTTAGHSRGWEDFFDIPPMQKWDQSRMQDWTSSDGYLTLHVKVSNVM